MIPEKAIRGFFKSHHPFIDDSDLPRRAEVALVLDVSLDNNDPNILFIQRAECEKDPWSGQMAFPGGRRETTDLVDGDAACRETAEEIGLQIGTAQLIGRLNDMRGRHGGRSADLMISCFVFVTDQIEQLALNHEVADVMHLPISQLLDPSLRTSIRYDSAGDIDFPGIFLSAKDERIIWGLTYRFLTDFFSLFDHHLPSR